jgi:hypothetical protein
VKRDADRARIGRDRGRREGGAKIEIAGETKIASDGRERARWVKTREMGENEGGD